MSERGEQAKRMAAIRRAVADYMWSEGCTCCESGDHGEHKAALAKLLRVPRFSDDSGYDFARYRTPDKKGA